MSDLLAGEANDVRGRALVDILGAKGEMGDTGQNMLELLLDQTDIRDEALRKRALVLCDDGWATAARARMMPEVVDGLAIGPADWRRGGGVLGSV